MRFLVEVRLLAQLAPIEECLVAPGFVESTRDGLVIHESWRNGERGITLTATAPPPG